MIMLKTERTLNVEFFLFWEKGESMQLKKDLVQKVNIKKNQGLYNYYLKNSAYNREVKDFRDGTYLTAGDKLVYKVSSTTLVAKCLMGYNFNHTLSPCYINYNNKLNLLKLSKIFGSFFDKYHIDEKFFFVTLTMPNLKADVELIEDNNNLIKRANQVITNLYKQLEKKYGSSGLIKKYEVTYKYNKGAAYSHPHFHLIITLPPNVRHMKSTELEISAREFIINYWYKNFLSKHFEIKFEDALGAFDMQEANYSKIKEELTGYMSRNNKYDYLNSQEVFDYAYCHMHNKRVLTYSGVFKKINQELKLEEIEEIELLEEDKEVYDIKVGFVYVSKMRQYCLIYTKLNEEVEPGLDISTSSSKNHNLLAEMSDHFSEMFGGYYDFMTGKTIEEQSEYIYV